MAPIPEPVSVEAQLAVINTKLDLLLTGRDDHEARIRILERFRWQLAGACVVVSGAVGALAPHLF